MGPHGLTHFWGGGLCVSRGLHTEALPKPHGLGRSRRVALTLYPGVGCRTDLRVCGCPATHSETT